MKADMERAGTGMATPSGMAKALNSFPMLSCLRVALNTRRVKSSTDPCNQHFGEALFLAERLGASFFSHLLRAVQGVMPHVQLCSFSPRTPPLRRRLRRCGYCAVGVIPAPYKVERQHHGRQDDLVPHVRVERAREFCHRGSVPNATPTGRAATHRWCPSCGSSCTRRRGKGGRWPRRAGPRVRGQRSSLRDCASR